jgi:hypothetical protein
MMPLPPSRGEFVEEQALAGDGALEHAAKPAAAGVGRHLDVARHPGHRARLGIDRLAGVEFEDDCLHGRADDLILHPGHATSPRRYDRIGKVQTVALIRSHGRKRSFRDMTPTTADACLS